MFQIILSNETALLCFPTSLALTKFSLWHKLICFIFCFLDYWHFIIFIELLLLKRDHIMITIVIFGTIDQVCFFLLLIYIQELFVTILDLWNRLIVNTPGPYWLASHIIAIFWPYLLTKAAHIFRLIHLFISIDWVSRAVLKLILLLFDDVTKSRRLLFVGIWVSAVPVSVFPLKILHGMSISGFHLTFLKFERLTDKRTNCGHLFEQSEVLSDMTHWFALL